jgi:hypothetical protein
VGAVPLLKPEEVVHFVIADQRVKDHLQTAESRRSRKGFRDYLAQYGIHDLGELSPSQMFSLVAARNCAPLIDLLQIPRGKDIYGTSAYASYDLHRPKTTLGPAMQEFLASTPRADREWEVLQDPMDIPEAVPEDLLLRRLAPQEFLRRLTEGELIRFAWIQEDLDENANAPIEQMEASMRQDQSAKTEDQRPFGYLLLDASESMGTSRDRRDEVARGIALAYLLSQFQAGNPTYVNLFRQELSPVYGGEGRGAFESAVNAVLGHSHEGMTQLQGALKLLSQTISSRQSRVDIALVTDGISRLSENPLGSAHLHTFLLGARPEEFEAYTAHQYQESLITLDRWSDFMFRLEPSSMGRASVPRREDVLDAARLLRGIEEEVATAASAEKIRRVQARLGNLKKLIGRYREEESPRDPAIEEAWEGTLAALAQYGAADPIEIAFQNASQWRPVDRELALSLESREVRGLMDVELLQSKWGTYLPPNSFANPLEVILKLIKTFLFKVKRKIRRFRPKRSR